MPKPMKMLVEVEELAYGRVLRLLDGTPGVVSITAVGDGPKQPKTASKGKAGTVYCLVLKFLIDAKTAVNRDALREVLKANGKAATSLPDTLSKLKKAKHITVAKATYTVTAAGRKFYETSCPIED